MHRTIDFINLFHILTWFLLWLLHRLTPSHYSPNSFSVHIYTNSQAHCNMFNPSITSLTHHAVSPLLSSLITIAFDLAVFAFYLLLISHSVYP